MLYNACDACYRVDRSLVPQVTRDLTIAGLSTPLITCYSESLL